MTPTYDNLVHELTVELFEHDQGYAPEFIEDDSEREEYEAVEAYVRETLLGIIAPYLPAQA